MSNQIQKESKLIVTIPVECELRSFVTEEGEKREYIAYTSEIDGNKISLQAKDNSRRLALYLLKHKFKNQEGVKE